MTTTVALIGAGQRGTFAYGPFAQRFPELLRFTAVAEPLAGRRERFSAVHEIPPERRFPNWEDLLARPRLADACLIATPDRDHHPAAVAAMQRGYHLLIEKPMATTVQHAVDLVRTAERLDRIMAVCHVLRFTPFFKTVHEIVTSGRLGDVVSASHRENVVHWHTAHSYVRGNWRASSQSAPLILAKACHDLDILTWNLPDPVHTVFSTGALMHFRRDKAPPGSTDRCTDGCPAADCPFDARRIYLDESSNGWPVHVITEDLSAEGRRRALEEGPYGRCVYRCDNDVVDQQTVLLQLAGGASVSLVVQGHSHEEARTMRYDGTRGTLRGIFGSRSAIEVHNHVNGATEQVAIPVGDGGHGGGDFGVLRAFATAVQSGRPPAAPAGEVLESHLLALAAERSRLSGTTVSMGDFRGS